MRSPLMRVSCNAPRGKPLRRKKSLPPVLVGPPNPMRPAQQREPRRYPHPARSSHRPPGISMGISTRSSTIRLANSPKSMIYTWAFMGSLSRGVLLAGPYKLYGVRSMNGVPPPAAASRAHDRHHTRIKVSQVLRHVKGVVDRLGLVCVLGGGAQSGFYLGLVVHDLLRCHLALSQPGTVDGRCEHTVRTNRNAAGLHRSSGREHSRAAQGKGTA